MKEAYVYITHGGEKRKGKFIIWESDAPSSLTLSMYLWYKLTSSQGSSFYPGVVEIIFMCSC